MAFVTIKGIAGRTMMRGQHCEKRSDGKWYYEPTMTKPGGMARKPYHVGEWPPVDILEGEEFEIMTSGGAMAKIGDKALWLDYVDGLPRFDNISEGVRGDYRQAFNQAKIQIPKTL